MSLCPLCTITVVLKMQEHIVRCTIKVMFCHGQKHYVCVCGVNTEVVFDLLVVTTSFTARDSLKMRPVRAEREGSEVHLYPADL